MTRDQEDPRSNGAPAIRMVAVSPPRPWPGRRGPVQGGRCSEPVGQHRPPVHHWGTICRERLLPHRKPIGSPIATRYEYQTRAQGGLVAGKIPGLTTLRPASRGVHHHLALLARGRGRHHAQDSHQPLARAAGAVPLAAARREGKANHTSPARRGSASLQGQEDVLLPDCPARRGWTRGRIQREVLLNAGPARTGARLPDRRPVCAHRAGTHSRQARCATCAYQKTPVRATGSNGLNTHHPPAGGGRVVNQGKGLRVGAVRRPAAGRTRGRGKEYQDEGP